MVKVTITFKDGKTETFTANESHVVNGDIVTWDFNEYKNISYNEDEIKKIEEVWLEE